MNRGEQEEEREELDNRKSFILLSLSLPEKMTMLNGHISLHNLRPTLMILDEQIIILFRATAPTLTNSSSSASNPPCTEPQQRTVCDRAHRGLKVKEEAKI